jgi:hypothetical protein
MRSPLVLMMPLLLGVGAGSCLAQQPERDRFLSALVQRYPCEAPRYPLLRAPDSVDARRSCALLAAAVDELAHADSARTGALPADTSSVGAATLDTLEERSLQDEGTRSSWFVVTLRLTDRPYNVEVRFDRSSGESSVRRVHKPLGGT